jgi:hypothetical protein
LENEKKVKRYESDFLMSKRKMRSRIILKCNFSFGFLFLNANVIEKSQRYCDIESDLVDGSRKFN